MQTNTVVRSGAAGGIKYGGPTTKAMGGGDGMPLPFGGYQGAGGMEQVSVGAGGQMGALNGGMNNMNMGMNMGGMNMGGMGACSGGFAAVPPGNYNVTNSRLSEALELVGE